MRTHFDELMEKMREVEEHARTLVKRMNPPPENEWRALAWSLAAELVMLKEEHGL